MQAALIECRPLHKAINRLKAFRGRLVASPTSSFRAVKRQDGLPGELSKKGIIRYFTVHAPKTGEGGTESAQIGRETSQVWRLSCLENYHDKYLSSTFAG